MTDGLNRRQFIGASSGALALGALSRPRGVGKADPKIPVELIRGTKTRIGKVYVGRKPGSWPTPAQNLEEEVKEYEKAFAALAPQMADIEFVGGDLAISTETVNAAKAKLTNVDGILILHLTLGTGPLINSLLELGVPVVVFARPYAGHEWHIIASMQRQGKKIEMYPSSDYGDLVRAVRPICALHRLKEAKVLWLPGTMKVDEAYAPAIKKKFGTTIEIISLDDLTRCYEAADKGEVAEEADRWKKNAKDRVEPSDEEIARSARMYLAMRDLMIARKAHAITLNCLGSGLIQKGQGYPCLGFARLCSMGLPGVCEADIKSTMTSLIFQYLVNKPGFVTDPVIDLSNNTIIHAHCVAPLRMDGPDGPECEYIMRSHLEDLKGCSLYVKMRKGQPISMARLIGDSIMLFSTGKIIDTPYVERGCRTKITTTVVNARKMMEDWSCGLHRVIFYGDHSTDIRRFARFTGIKVLEEGVDDIHSVPGLEWNPVVHA
ncbi:MAG: hypothetical protein N3D11_09280 [Candidatus Sumerlaeia bacterium]|nr:hypothetical protein [Candidatus Sumerlaeia bacterium]